MMVSGAEPYFHEEIKRVDSFCFSRYKILVIIGESKMVDVDLMKQFFCF